MRWIEQSLNRKFALGTAAGLLISSLAFLVLFVGLNRAQLERERSDAATQITRLLQTSLENAMLKRDLEGLKDIVNRLGREPGIFGVMITNPRGEIRFASSAEQLGEQIPPDPKQLDHATTRFLDRADDRAVLRSVNPVHNKPTCEECHGPVTHNPVNGILYVDFDAAPIRQEARKTTLMLMSAGALIVAINLLGGWWFMRRFVIRPVQHLADVSQRLSQGDLAARASPTEKDELSRLGERFNQMAARLQDKVDALRDKEHFMQQLVDAIPDGIRVIDADYQVVLANATYHDQLGLKPDENRKRLCFAEAHGRQEPCPATLMTCPLKELEQNRKPLRVVHRHQRTDGSPLDVELYAAPMDLNVRGEPKMMVVESVRDLEQKVKFTHEQRLSELGRLAAGVAHEIHNPLAAVRLALHAAEQANRAEQPERDQVSEYLVLVDQEVEKCSQVTERLLKLSVAPPEQQELVGIDTVVDDTLKLLRWEAQTCSVDIRLLVEGAPLRIIAMDSDLRMVTLNLSQNALHAMPRGGTLTVRCRRSDGRVEIRFEDTGIGIGPKEQLRIFEPFFSRRADGVRGTGLGLSITKSIVENHGGTIAVDSLVGYGSRITVSFPDADRETGD